MLKRFLCLMVLLAFTTGCGLKAQTYVMTKQRVGIEKGSGNAGFLSGTPQYVEPQQKTRKVYVLEITKAIPESEARKIQQEIDVATKTTVDTTVHIPPQPAPVVEKHTVNKIVIPRIEDTDSKPEAVVTTPMGPKEDQTYTVLKDDTLQKIAKKFYGTYSAWLKIYNANKEKIKDPNFVRPGTVLTLPAVK